MFGNDSVFSCFFNAIGVMSMGFSGDFNLKVKINVCQKKKLKVYLFKLVLLNLFVNLSFLQKIVFLYMYSKMEFNIHQKDPCGITVHFYSKINVSNNIKFLNQRPLEDQSLQMPKPVSNHLTVHHQCTSLKRYLFKSLGLENHNQTKGIRINGKTENCDCLSMCFHTHIYVQYKKGSVSAIQS